METKTELFDVVIVGIKDGKVASVIGTNLNERQADKRVETGLMRINDRYFVAPVPTGKFKEGDSYAK